MLAQVSGRKPFNAQLQKYEQKEQMRFKELERNIASATSARCDSLVALWLNQMFLCRASGASAGADAGASDDSAAPAAPVSDFSCVHCSQPCRAQAKKAAPKKAGGKPALAAAAAEVDHAADEKKVERKKPAAGKGVGAGAGAGAAKGESKSAGGAGGAGSAAEVSSVMSPEDAIAKAKEIVEPKLIGAQSLLLLQLADSSCALLQTILPRPSGRRSAQLSRLCLPR